MSITTVSLENKSPLPSYPVAGNSIHHNVVAHVLTQCLSSHILSGLCKIMGYDILRHGTSWDNYKSIIRTGANPKKGGETTKKACEEGERRVKETRYDYVGGKRITIEILCDDPTDGEKAENHFYVFRDSAFGVRADGTREISPFLAMLVKRLFPLRHTYLAYKAQIGRLHATTADKIANIAKTIFTPKIKFIYSPQEINDASPQDRFFENDPDYGDEAAYRTTHHLPADRIGLIGFCSHVNMKHAWEHLKSHPGRAALGIAQLAVGIILTAIPGAGFLT
jgi:hypothetical protein